MNLNQTTRNALIVMGHIAQLPKGHYALAKQLSSTFNLNAEYLMKILSLLRRAGILLSKRGLHGGYALAKPAKDISLFEIINTICGPLQDFSVDESYKNQPLVQNLIRTHLAATTIAISVLKKAKLAEMIKVVDK